MIQACSQDFLRGGAILRGETDKTICQRRKSGLGEMQVCLRLHFEHFQELGISQTFSLQKYFFFNRVLYFTIFLELKCGMSLFKTKKG